METDSPFTTFKKDSRREIPCDGCTGAENMDVNAVRGVGRQWLFETGPIAP
jgi:hypothetical protein